LIIGPSFGDRRARDLKSRLDGDGAVGSDQGCQLARRSTGIARRGETIDETMSMEDGGRHRGPRDDHLRRQIRREAPWEPKQAAADSQ
jgi:hypothetical protein